MSELLFPAYQKLYSALKSLEQFDKEANFFDNISCLDSFFSEYRNVTFVIQSQIKHMEYFDYYVKLRDKYLTDHWFVEKRNETIKQKPFQLIKEIKITVYLPFHGFSIFEKSFSVSDDTPIDSLHEDIKRLFSEVDSPEIFFSVVYSFHEMNSDVDLLDKLISGISSMLRFLKELETYINQDTPLCNQIKEKIYKFSFINSPRDFLLIDDYVYYSDTKSFFRGERMSASIMIDDTNALKNLPLSSLTQSDYLNYDGTPFGNFTIKHALLRILDRNTDIMPSFLIVYGDETYDIDCFHASIKTTFYRKINEISAKIEKENVIEVCYVSLYSIIPVDKNLPQKSKERVEISKSDILLCSSIDKDLNEQEYVFEGDKMDDIKYVGFVLRNGRNKKLQFSKLNMVPIYNAFKIKRNRVNGSKE